MQFTKVNMMGLIVKYLFVETLRSKLYLHTQGLQQFASEIRSWNKPCGLFIKSYVSDPLLTPDTPCIFPKLVKKLFFFIMPTGNSNRELEKDIHRKRWAPAQLLSKSIMKKQPTGGLKLVFVSVCTRTEDRAGGRLIQGKGCWWNCVS